MALSSLAGRLTYMTREKYGAEDPNWVQYVDDHKLYIREKSPIQHFMPIDLVRYRYRPVDFFKDNNGDPMQTWIFMAVNDLHNVSEFNESITQLWMVKSDTIHELRAMYESTRQYQAESQVV